MAGSWDESKDQQPQQNQTARSSPFNLSPEETQVFQECRREALIYRSVPFSVMFGTAASAFSKMNVRGFRPSAKSGALFPILGSCLVGYWIGKFSYFTECENKFLQRLPDSKVSQFIRAKRENNRGELERLQKVFGVQTSIDSMGQVEENSKQGDQEAKKPSGVYVSKIDVDIEKPTYYGKDEYRATDSFEKPKLDTNREATKYRLLGAIKI